MHSGWWGLPLETNAMLDDLHRFTSALHIINFSQYERETAADSNI